MKERRLKRRVLPVVALVGFLSMGTGTAWAIPELQIYIEGATYDTTTETWVTSASDFTLWVLGNVDGPGGHGSINDVSLAAAFSSSEGGSISLTPTTASGITDPSTPDAPGAGPSGTGDAPLMGDGSPLPDHGIYGPGTSWVSFLLGDFTLTDSEIGDFTQGACPGPSCELFSNAGQINAYQVSITGFTQVHFDAFNSILGANHSLFAPFSHDGETTTTPEPASVLLLGFGLLGLGLWRRRRSRSAAA